VTATLAGRHDKLAGVVGDLGTLTENTVGQQEKLRETLTELPSTLDSAKGTLDQVPSAGKAALPLLHDLRPATARLPAVSRNLKPLLKDLRPTIAELRPTLGSASELLDHTPGLLDSAHGTVPGLTKAVSTLRPAVGYLRPYTPEIMGFVSDWGDLFSQFDSQGHFAHALITEGQTSVDNNPPVVTPNTKVDTRSTPGRNGGQPWTDATGSGPR
jgi:phospholipid/cholesterol/gamma-HCH transport system substrate-binding protein